MKPKNLWLLALGMVLLCGLAWWKQLEQNQNAWKLAIESQKVVFQAPYSPKFVWQALETEETEALKNLNRLSIGTKQVFSSSAYLQVQPGLFLIELNKQRIFLFTQVVELDPTLAIDFKNDWVVLAKSSLWPTDFPEPRKGWVVLNTGTLSKKLKQLSLETQKPIVRPVNSDVVWLQKTDQTPWEVLTPLN